MSDMTIVQLMASQKERELRAQHILGPIDWLTIPCFAGCIMLCVLVVSTLALLLWPICQVTTWKRLKRRATHSASTVAP
jgi:hypothetical protein